MVAVLDLHASVSDKMIDNSTCVYAYRKNPHSDSRDAAIKAALILNDLFENPNVNQVNYKTKYILPPTGVGTANDPMKSVLLEANKIEKNDKDIICINVMAGYSYADIADCGFSLLSSAMVGIPSGGAEPFSASPNTLYIYMWPGLLCLLHCLLPRRSRH